MFTLVYLKNQFNRPDTLLSFLQSNIGKNSLIQIDCITPFQGKENDLAVEVCEYLSNIDQSIEVTYRMTQNVSTETNVKGCFVRYLVIQVQVGENVFNKQPLRSDF